MKPKMVELEGFGTVSADDAARWVRKAGIAKFRSEKDAKAVARWASLMYQYKFSVKRGFGVYHVRDEA